MTESQLSPDDGRAEFRPDSVRAGRVLAQLAASLRAETEALEPADFDDLARAVDGVMGAAERDVWQERLARDPILAARAADLARFRSAIGGEAGLLLFRRRQATLSKVGWIAAAAMLLFALAVREVPRLLTPDGQPRDIFADDFEDGNASSWSVSPSG